MATAALALTRIHQTLAAHRPIILPADRPHAAVAMVLSDAPGGPEVLFIVRAPHDDDPWSGNIAFPGGRVAPGDTGARQTAERETFEELALELSGCDYLGRLDDLYGATLPILVSAFVYATQLPPPITTNHEIARTFWYPLAALGAPKQHRQATFCWRGELTTQPVTEILPAGEPLLWGITYRLLRNFFALMGRPFGEDPPRTLQNA
jgi:8-oxo-dGTP pyrophosphatase MutT (NUDIX family)